MGKGPQYSDATDGIRLMRIGLWFGPACFIMLTGLWVFMWLKGWIPGPVMVLLIVLNIPITVAGVLAIHRVVGDTAVLFMKTVFAVGDIPPPPTYPRQDVLIAQGKYAEAADWFRDHIRIEPEDHEARLRLAQLLETRLEGYDEAERLYIEIRNAQPPAQPRQQMQAANLLIDLYRKVGKTDRLKAELARFAARYRGTSLGDGAARELSRLKQGLDT